MAYLLLWITLGLATILMIFFWAISLALRMTILRLTIFFLLTSTTFLCRGAMRILTTSLLLMAISLTNFLWVLATLTFMRKMTRFGMTTTGFGLERISFLQKRTVARAATILALMTAAFRLSLMVLTFKATAFRLVTLIWAFTFTSRRVWICTTLLALRALTTSTLLEMTTGRARI